MDDSSGGQPSAAQSAPEPEQAATKGLFGRLIGAFNSSDSDNDANMNGGAGPGGRATASGFVGLGNLRHMRVDDVVIPRVEVISAPVDISLADLVALFHSSGLSRLPVYKGTLDTPIGLIHLKDLALKHGFNPKSEKFNLRKMLRPLLYAPPSMPIGVLLQKMQTERTHMALVIDEYGGVDGLVTIEDLIEQVIGEIEDEHDTTESSNWSLDKPGCYSALAKTPLEEFEKEIGMTLIEDADSEEIDTLGGLVFMLAGHVPARGEVVKHPEGLEFEVVEADPRRIKRLRVLLPEALRLAKAS